MRKTIIQFSIFLVIVAIFGVFIFRFIDWADKNKNESAAIGTLEDIVAVQKKSDCASLKEMLEKQMIDPKLNDGEKAGYIFAVKKIDNKCELTAIPKNSSNGNLSFYSTNEDNWKIHFSKNTDIMPDKNSLTLDTNKNY